MKQWRIMVRIVLSCLKSTVWKYCKKYSVIQICKLFSCEETIFILPALHCLPPSVIPFHLTALSVHFISQKMNRSNYTKFYKEYPIILTRKLLKFSSLIRKYSVSHLLSTSTNLPILSAYRDSPFWIEESLDMSVPVIHL